MYCENCGNKVDDDAVFCTKCGKQFSQKNKRDTNNIKINPKNIKMNTVNFKVSKKIIMIVGLALIVILLMMIGIKGIGTTGSARKVAVAATKYSIEGKINKYYKLLASPYKEYMCGSNGWYKDENEFKKDIEDLENEQKQSILNACGNHAEIKYSVDYTVDCDADQLDAVRRELARDYDYNPDDIQDAMVVSVAINATGSNGQSNWTDENSCVKIHGKWYIHRPGFESVD